MRHRAARLVTLVHHLTASEHRGPRRALRLLAERPLLLASDRIVVTSDTTRASVIAAGADAAAVRVVKPGRDRLGVRTAPPARRSSDPLRLLFIGSLTPRKDVLALLRAFAAVEDRAVLTLAGPVERDVRYAAEVRRSAARFGQRVRITGCLRDDALEAELDRHDVLVLPSRYEGFGIAVAEALSHGLAVVASRAGALPELVRDGEEACLVTPGDDGALARVLGELTLVPARVEAMQAKALRRAASLPVWADAQHAFAEALSF
jgi:glycosyltransferase involved in cell wall biosynthesis